MRFTLINLLLIIQLAFMYLFFRAGVYDYFAMTKIGKMFLRKHNKGFFNSLFFKEVHRQRNIGAFYYLNIAFLASLAIYIFAFGFVWVPFMKLPIIVSGYIVCLVCIPATFKALVAVNRAQCGRSFVFFDVEKGVRRHIHCFLEWLYCIFPLALYTFLLYELYT
ncbi:MAG: hypothetical protein IJB49_07475 [Clostridia bacterium]|nr:hypothetical protein [Clostridia bacterium]